jgi:hypothetical protein
MKLIQFVRPFGRSLKGLLLLLTLPAVVQAQSYTNNYGCPGLTSFTIPGSFTTIEYQRDPQREKMPLELPACSWGRGRFSLSY